MNQEDSTKVSDMEVDTQNKLKHAGRKTLTSKDICEIIKACYNSNVTKLNYRDLSIEFSADQAYLKTDQVLANPTQKTNIEVDEDLTLDERMEQELDLLKVTDPVAYEKFVTDEH